MQSLTYQHNTGFIPAAMINRAQSKQDHDHDLIRDAVRAWASAIDNQDVVSALINSFASWITGLVRISTARTFAS